MYPNFDINKIDFSKSSDGLIPSIIQHAQSKEVLMLGYMNKESVQKTLETRKATFFSRSKNRLWLKGESSENYLNVQSICYDCDQDALLLQCLPDGPTCHKGTDSCFTDSNLSFLHRLEGIIEERLASKDENSYTYRLTQKGINKVAQKVGEEAVEIVIEAKDNNDDLFLNEAADLMYHYILLLNQKGKTLKDVEGVLIDRNK